MAANINDKFTSATNGSRPSPTTLTAIHTGGDTTMTCNALTGWPTDTAVHFIIYTTDTDGNKVAGSQTDWKGVVSGSTITNCVLKAGTDSGYSIGAIVECAPTAAWADDLTDGLRVEHDQDGTHSDITATSVTATSGTFTSLTVTGTATSQGWTPLGDVPDTITYNGNRNYDLVFNSVDLSSTLSPGMKLQLTRTVAAPDQCADLEASSSQYFSKSSPSGMTFTDDFAVSAWVKLESYATGGIASRFNGTSGWSLRVNSDGTLAMYGYNAGGANFSGVKSYASLPLNKWVHISVQLDMSAFTATTTTSYVMFDGVDVSALVERGGTNPTALVQAGNLEIGSYNASNFFDGKLAQVAIFNAKVTQATMRGYMSQGLSGSETSLISAYSFDNAITDLNTTNANNLTANGGAAATATDSPFANAVTAGLLEYAEINSVAFSTNTTVNVRVPDTCMIPTSGGVSAVSYSTQSNPYGLPYFSKIIAKTILANSSATSSGSIVQMPGMLASPYIPANSLVRIRFYCQSADASVANAGLHVGLYDTTVAGTRLTNSYNIRASTQTSNAETPAPRFDCTIFIPTAGVKTFTVGYSTSAGTYTVAGGATVPMELTVELV
jgi:hypothetical protein